MVWFEIGFEVGLDDARFPHGEALLVIRSWLDEVAGSESLAGKGILFPLTYAFTSCSTFLHGNPPRIGFGIGSRERVLVLGQKVYSLAGSPDGCPRPSRSYWFLLHISGP